MTHLRPVYLLVFLGFSAAMRPALLAQTSGLSAPLVLRSQAASIAEESLAALGTLASGSNHMGVIVSGGSARTIIENAFLELYSRRGFRVSLQGSDAARGDQLQVTVLDQSVRYGALQDGQYRREIMTAIEARHTSKDTSFTRYLGLFKRQAVDTVGFREDGGSGAAGLDSERTLIDRLLGPVLLIGGAFLIVYLFFTVRN
jgi:hypothetical protein